MIIESLEVRQPNGTPQGQTVAIIDGNGLELSVSRTIVVAATPGRKGQIAYDADNLYICVAANTWKKVALEVIA